MTVEAELFDGTILEFPDETDRTLIQSKVKELTAQRQSGSKPVTYGGPMGQGSPSESPSRYSKLLGGAEAKLQTAPSYQQAELTPPANPTELGRMPGYLGSFVEEATAPYQASEETLAGVVPPVGERFSRALQFFNAPFAAISRGTTKYAGEAGFSPRAAEAIGEGTGAVAGMIPIPIGRATRAAAGIYGRGRGVPTEGEAFAGSRNVTPEAPGLPQPSLKPGLPAPKAAAPIPMRDYTSRPDAIPMRDATPQSQARLILEENLASEAINADAYLRSIGPQTRSGRPRPPIEPELPEPKFDIPQPDLPDLQRLQLGLNRPPPPQPKSFEPTVSRETQIETPPAPITPQVSPQATAPVAPGPTIEAPRVVEGQPPPKVQPAAKQPIQAPEIEGKSTAIDEATRRVQAIEEEWVSKNFHGPTNEQQARILSEIRATARKYKVNPTELRKQVLFEPAPFVEKRGVDLRPKQQAGRPIQAPEIEGIQKETPGPEVDILGKKAEKPQPEGPTIEPAAKKIESGVRQIIKFKGLAGARKVKAELVTRIEKAIEKAPEKAELDAQVQAINVARPVYEHFYEKGKLVSQPERIKAYKTALAKWDKINGPKLDRLEKGDPITIAIPGDGVFKVRNTKEDLTEILNRAKGIETRTEPIKPRGYVEPKRTGKPVELEEFNKEALSRKERETTDPEPSTSESSDAYKRAGKSLEPSPTYGAFSNQTIRSSRFVPEGERFRASKLSPSYASNEELMGLVQTSTTLDDIKMLRREWAGRVEAKRGRTSELDQIEAELKDKEFALTPKRTAADILKSEKGALTFTRKDKSPFVGKTRLRVGGTIEQASKTVRKTMGEEGNDLADRLLTIRNKGERESGMANQPVESAIKKLKKSEYVNAVDAAEGNAAPLNARVADYVKAWTRARTQAARRAKEVGLETKNPITGEYYPFTELENYFPHYTEKGLAKFVEDPAARAKVRAKIKEQLGEGATNKQVNETLRAMLKANKLREGHLEIARIFDAPYKKDPRAALTYLRETYRRINIAEQFGSRLKRLEDILTAIDEKRGSVAEDFARVLANRELRIEEVPDKLWQQSLAGIRNFNALTMLSRAFIPNLSQHAYTVVLTGYKNTVKGLRQAATQGGKEFARRAGVVGDAMVGDFMNEAMGMSKGRLSATTDVVLTPFHGTEHLNRVGGANAGKFFARETFAKLKKHPKRKGLRRELEKMDVDVEEALKRGSLSEIDELKAAQNIVNRSQFKVDPMELPLFWSSPEGKTLTQFQSFKFKSGQFMKDEILKEIGKGNVKPFLRAITILPIAGFAVKKVQDALKPGGNKEDRDTIVDYLGAVGVLGMFAGALTAAGSRAGPPSILGPTVSNITRGVDALSRTKERIADDKPAALQPLGSFLAGHVPFVGPNLRAALKEERPVSRRTEIMREMGHQRDPRREYRERYRDLRR